MDNLKETKKVVAAKENYEKCMEKIAPYIQKATIVENTTAGKWCNSDCFINKKNSVYC